MSGSTSFRVGVRQVGETDVVAPTGEIDIATASAVRDAMLATVGPRRLVLDLRGVEFMDTSGLSLLVEEQRRSRQRGGSFEVVPGPTRVQRLLDIAGLTPLLQMVAPPAEAVTGAADSRG